MVGLSRRNRATWSAAPRHRRYRPIRLIPLMFKGACSDQVAGGRRGAVNHTAYGRATAVDPTSAVHGCVQRHFWLVYDGRLASPISGRASCASPRYRVTDCYPIVPVPPQDPRTLHLLHCFHMRRIWTYHPWIGNSSLNNIIDR